MEETDSLASLEERIVRAVELITQLRQEKDSAQKLALQAAGDQQAAEQLAAEMQARNTKLTEELTELKAERKQVRSRIEKLLGQMDLLSAS